MYNEILVIPFLGFDKYTRDALAKHQEDRGLLDDKTNESQSFTGGNSQYLPPSPQAHYDYQKNVRSIEGKSKKGGDRSSVNVEGL
jgi:hypothetical protein